MKPFTTIAIFIFSIIALLHLLRLFFGWEVIVYFIGADKGYVYMIIPLWASIIGFMVAAGLAVMLWKEMRK